MRPASASAADQTTDQTADPHHLQRFLDAQDGTYAEARRELAEGHKRSHWMWFIFPQIAGLGSSPMAQRYAIAGLAEAAAYLAHPVLGDRLRESTALTVAAAARQPRPSASAIFPYPDDLKFHSSVTLFAHAAGATGEAEDPNNVFRGALDLFFAGHPDGATVARL